MLCNIKYNSSFILLDAGNTDLSPRSSAILVVVRVPVGFASPDIHNAVVVDVDNSSKGIHEILQHVVNILLIGVARAHPSE
jgi:hypothetical protein